MSGISTISFFPKIVMVYQTGRVGSITNTFSKKHFDDLQQQLASDVQTIQQHPDESYREIGYAFWAQELCWILAYPPMLEHDQFICAEKKIKPYLFVLKHGFGRRVHIVRALLFCLGTHNTMRSLNLFLRFKAMFGLA